VAAMLEMFGVSAFCAPRSVAEFKALQRLVLTLSYFPVSCCQILLNVWKIRAGLDNAILPFTCSYLTAGANLFDQGRCHCAK
jgi:hypothetical protein